MLGVLQSLLQFKFLVSMLLMLLNFYFLLWLSIKNSQQFRRCRGIFYITHSCFICIILKINFPGKGTLVNNWLIGPKYISLSATIAGGDASRDGSCVI